MELGDAIAPVRAKRRPRLPVAISPEETQAVLRQMQGLHLLMADVQTTEIYTHVMQKNLQSVTSLLDNLLVP